MSYGSTDIHAETLSIIRQPLILAPIMKNIARIAKRCPENIASVVKCVKLFLPECCVKAIKIPTKHTETSSTVCQVVRNCIKCNLVSLESVLSNGKHCRYNFGRIAYDKFSGKSSMQRQNLRKLLSCENFKKKSFNQAIRNK